MPATIPQELADLLSREKQALAHLGLVMPNGHPQVSPIWFDWDGTHIILNTARGRVKDRVMKTRPHVSVEITDPANPYRYVEIRGPIVDETEQGGYDTICDLRHKYHGDRNYPKIPGEVRVTYRVLPTHVVSRP